MKIAPGCRAVRQQDQMYCKKCGLLWDLDDPEPPACLNPLPHRDRDHALRSGVDRINEKLKEVK